MADEINVYDLEDPVTEIITVQDVQDVVTSLLSDYTETASFDFASIEGTSTISGSDASLVQDRAEALYNKIIFLGDQDDGLTVAGPGSVTRHQVNTRLHVSGSGVTEDLGGDTVGFKDASGSTLLDYDNSFELNIVAQFETYSTAVAAGVDGAGFGMGIEVTAGSSRAITSRGVRFYNEGNTLYASNADGTSETRTDVTKGITLTNFNSYRMVFTAATDAKFYINDVLVATHTTNIPSAGSGYELLFQVFDNNTSTGVAMLIQNNYQLITIL